MAFKDLSWVEQKKREENALLLRQLLSSGANLVPGQKFSMGPKGFNIEGSTQPLMFQSGQEEEPSPFFRMDKDTGKLERVNVPGLKSKGQVIDFNPPSAGGEKKTTQHEIDLNTHQQWLKAIAGMADLTETLEKQMEATAPRLKLEKVMTRGPEATNFFGRKTGKRLPGVTYYKPKGTMTEDELDVMAEDELRKDLKENGEEFFKRKLDPDEIEKLMTPGNIEVVKKQIKARKK